MCVCVCVCAIRLNCVKKIKKIKKRYRVHPIIRNRLEKGQFFKSYEDLRKHPEKFFKYTRMNTLFISGNL